LYRFNFGTLILFSVDLAENFNFFYQETLPDTGRRLDISSLAHTAKCMPKLTHPYTRCQLF
ncbi:MAG: hypothetical protein QGG39_06640, partial [Candidatus Poribacteria bacterium]|nr:hypothetical protein [Candidatus Poribacteria bacterium]